MDIRGESPKVKWLGKPSENSQILQLKLSRKKCITKRQSLKVQSESEPAPPLLLIFHILINITIVHYKSHMNIFYATPWSCDAVSLLKCRLEYRSILSFVSRILVLNVKSGGSCG